MEKFTYKGACSKVSVPITKYLTFYENKNEFDILKFHSKILFKR